MPAGLPPPPLPDPSSTPRGFPDPYKAAAQDPPFLFASPPPLRRIPPPPMRSTTAARSTPSPSATAVTTAVTAASRRASPCLRPSQPSPGATVRSKPSPAFSLTANAARCREGTFVV
nr:classical arabinogalactan protein 9-like [Aegilops tauschii subsp. strangulata]